MKINADSCLIESFIARVKASKLGNGAIVLPGKLHDFITKNGGESVFSKEKDLHFYGPSPLAHIPMTTQKTGATLLEDIEEMYTEDAKSDHTDSTDEAYNES